MAESPTDAYGRIFISYRREDSAYPAGWLFDRLAERFGVEQVFKDVDSIELGDDFVQVIGEAVGSTDVLLALIGEQWLDATDEEGSRRLDDPDDFVRLEIESALARNVRVIPILVEGATMPREAELPPSLRPLARRQALELSSTRFAHDTGRLFAVLDRTLAEERAAERGATKEGVHELAPDGATVPATRKPAAPPPPPPGAPEPPGRRRGPTARPRLLIGIAGAAVFLALLIGGAILLFADGESPTPSAPSPPSPSPEEGGPVLPNAPLAFTSDQSGESEIWSKPPGESAPSQLTSDFADVRRPDWSPDGKKIAFTGRENENDDDFDLWILDTEGAGDPTRLTEGPADDRAPSWSPDGESITFERRQPGESKDIWIVDSDGGGERRVTDDPGNDDTPDWSPDGNRIAFASDRHGDYDIYTLNPTRLERDVKQVTSKSSSDRFPNWSPDGNRIAFQSTPKGEPDLDIYTIDSLGRERPERLTNDGGNEHPSWSPDGKLIAFDSQRGGRTRLYAVPSQGGEREQLVFGLRNARFPVWSTSP